MHVNTIRQSECQSECCVLIGLAVRKRPVLGVCFIPKMDEFHGEHRGPWCDESCYRGYQWAKGHPDIPKMHHDTPDTVHLIHKCTFMTLRLTTGQTRWS